MATTRYGSRTLRCVQAIAGTSFKYGFYTNLERTDDFVALGQTLGIINGDYAPGLVIGANAPRPAKVQIYRSTVRASTTSSGGNAAGGFDSSYCGADSFNTAKAAGWKITKMPRRRLGSTSARSVAVYVKIATVGIGTGTLIKYAWRLHKGTWDRITSGDRDALGLNQATSDDKDLVWGARYPELPRARFIAVQSSGTLQSISTMVDPSKINSLPSGWTAVDVSSL